MEFNSASAVIEPREIHQGDLVFIVHKTKPTKTGWWRKMRMHQTCQPAIAKYDKGVQYVFEKPMHKDFRPGDFDSSRQEDGVFIMRESTMCDERWRDSYEIIYQAKGVASVMVINNNYMPPERLFYSRTDFQYTRKGVELFNYYNEIVAPDPMKELANSLRRG